ncbi:hypothetical protein FRC08_012670 [Ceratobasidium sp. 394]|nr:hypothetical protein FRC08_012670 [Ceratobasidium sp. 394]
MTRQPDAQPPSVISVASILASTRYELAHFILLDSFCSMLYALPQVIDYDTSVMPLESDIHPVEWFHGCPATFQATLVDINSLFHRKQPGLRLEWKSVERYLKSWRPVVQTSGDGESWGTIARLAIQESWRHTLLIYLYMAVCGTTSDDPRVQASVRQVFQLITTVKQSEKTLVSIHLLGQCLVAGVCARTEKQRATARERLGDPFNNGIWILRGSDFLPVLDHLWHGAAANGQPIRWSDYVFSRRAALPIAI